MGEVKYGLSEDERSQALAPAEAFRTFMDLDYSHLSKAMRNLAHTIWMNSVAFPDWTIERYVEWSKPSHPESKLNQWRPIWEAAREHETLTKAQARYRLGVLNRRLVA